MSHHVSERTRNVAIEIDASQVLDDIWQILEIIRQVTHQESHSIWVGIYLTQLTSYDSVVKMGNALYISITVDTNMVTVDFQDRQMQVIHRSLS